MNRIFFLCFLLQGCCVPFNRLIIKHNFSSINEKEAIVNDQYIVCKTNNLEVNLLTKTHQEFKALDFIIINRTDSPLLICNNVRSSVSNKIFYVYSGASLTMKSDLEFIILESGKSVKLGAGLEGLDAEEIFLSLKLINDLQEYLHSAEIKKSDLKIYCSDENPVIVAPFNRHPDKGFTELLIKGIKFKNNQKGDILYSVQNY